MNGAPAPRPPSPQVQPALRLSACFQGSSCAFRSSGGDPSKTDREDQGNDCVLRRVRPRHVQTSAPTKGKRHEPDRLYRRRRRHHSGTSQLCRPALKRALPKKYAMSSDSLSTHRATAAMATGAKSEGSYIDWAAIMAGGVLACADRPGPWGTASCRHPHRLAALTHRIVLPDVVT